MTKVVLRPQAEDDLAAIYDFIADDAGARIADGYLQRLAVAIGALGSFPERGSLRPEIGEAVRSLGFERRVTLLFRLRKNEVEVLRVLYGGRDVDQALNEDQEP